MGESGASRLRREKLAGLVFDAVKYVVTIGILGISYATIFTEKPLPIKLILLNLAIAVVGTVVAYYVTPQDL